MNPRRFAQLAQAVIPDSNLLRFWPLAGGISAQVTALEVVKPDGSTQKLVVRQHGDADRAGNPAIARDEFRLLTALYTAGLPVPEPYYADDACIVVSFVEGVAEFNPPDVDACVQAMATQLAAIHRVRGADFAFLPDAAIRYTRCIQQGTTDPATEEGRIRAGLQAVWPLTQANRPGVLHGDFWPGNLLWRDGRIAAVIDWEDAAYGDPLADIANTRLEILWAFGFEAMQTFTQHYQSLMSDVNRAGLPYWDLCAALRTLSQFAGWTNDPARVAAMQDGHREFVAQAFAQLSGYG